jgi:hypothetical protein
VVHVTTDDYGKAIIDLMLFTGMSLLSVTFAARKMRWRRQSGDLWRWNSSCTLEPVYLAKKVRVSSERSY